MFYNSSSSSPPYKYLNRHSVSTLQVSVKEHVPSSKEVVEKKIRKKERCEKYENIERHMIHISHTQYIVKYFGYLEDQVGVPLFYLCS